MLVEELWGRVDVVVSARVGAAYDHDGVALCCGGGGVVDAVVVDGGLEEMGVLFEPVNRSLLAKIEWNSACIVVVREQKDRKIER